MPSYFINGGAVAGTVDFYRMVGINDEERGPLYRPAQKWNYQRRSRVKTWDRHNFFSCWTTAGGGFIDPANAAGTDLLFGDHGLETGADWEPMRIGDKGCTRPYYIYGGVYDANGNPVAGATVESYTTTAPEVEDGATVSGGDGSYAVPCYNRTTAHHVTAYKSGSPDVAGHSVNTLIPSV